MPIEEVLTLREAAALLEMAGQTACVMVRRGELPGFKVGGQWRFKGVDTDAWMEARMRAERPGGERGS